MTANDIVAAALASGLDAIAVTDHNSAAFVEDVCKEAALRDPPLAVYPGVEATSSEGAHLLVLFPPETAPDVIKGFLGSCEIDGADWGESHALARRNYHECILRAEAAKGIAIAAHADRPATTGKKETSLLYAIQPGQPRQHVLRMTELRAAEVCTDDGEARAELRSEDPVTGLPLRPCFRSSDAHAVGQIGRASTWFKMTRPDGEGLRLALADGEMSLLVANGNDPNRHAPLVIESVVVSDGKLMGRGAPFELRLNPWLNTIIGGRGTGKSSVVEFLRLALRRGDELPPALKTNFEEFAKVPQNRDDRGLLTESTRVEVIYRKDEARFRVNWANDGSVAAIESELDDGSWAEAQGDVTQRFPIRLYSQKQIFEMAEGPESLLRVIDDSEAVDKAGWEEQWRVAEASYLSLRAQAREIETALQEEGRLKGQLDDANKKLAVFESSDHRNILQDYRRRQDQLTAVSGWEEELKQVAPGLRVAADRVAAEFDESAFDPEDEVDAELLAAVAEEKKKLAELQKQTELLAANAESHAAEWALRLQRLKWSRAAATATDAYDGLLERLRNEGAGSPDEYAGLVHLRENITARLEELAQSRKDLAELEVQAEAALAALLTLRGQLTERRRNFLQGVLGSNKHVRIKAVAFGDRVGAEVSLRALLGRESPSFQNDIASDDGTGLLPELYKNFDSDESSEFETHLATLRQRLIECARGRAPNWNVRDRRFVSHLRTLAPETLDRLSYWAPADALEVFYSRSIDGADFRPIHQGSPGEKTAAILAFLLSYGDEPIVLDQPEDDLENRLIYDLIVAQLRENKKRRQILVVTHNPNIVVNGDAEFVATFDFKGGQTVVAQQGGLQELDIREEICSVMEGGRAAFEQRYQRIGRH